MAFYRCSSGKKLPTLTNEATAADLKSGKQLISSSDTIVTGTAEILNMSYKIDVTSNGNLKTGTFTIPDITKKYLIYASDASYDYEAVYLYSNGAINSIIGHLGWPVDFSISGNTVTFTSRNAYSCAILVIELT